jgi:hypothetical protein
MVTDLFADVCSFSYTLFLADITADEIEAVITYAGKVP